MTTKRFLASGSLRQGAPAPAASAAAAVVLAAALVAGGAPVAAAARPGGSALRGGPGAGVISTVAGGVGGPARATKVALGDQFTGADACGVAFGAGQLYIADSGSLRAVNPSTDWLATPAGTGVGGPRGDGGRAARASFSGACGAVVDHSGNLAIADAGNNRVRMVAHSTGTFYGQRMTAGNIYTVAGTGSRAGFSGDGGPATRAKLYNPRGVTVDAAGNLLIADWGNARVRVVAASTGTFYGQPMTAGNIYTIAGGGTSGLGDGGPATKAELTTPTGVVVDAAGNLLIADSEGNLVRMVAHSTGTFYGQPMTAGDIYTIAGTGTGGFSGDGGPATSAELNGPEGVAVDAAGNAIIADLLNFRVRVVAHSTGTFYGKPMTAGNIYTIAGTGKSGFSGDGGPATSAELNEPEGVAVDAAGNVIIANSRNNRVRVVAHSTGTFYGKPMTAGDIYTIAGTGTNAFSGDGGPATRAQLNFPESVAVDAAGNLLIADDEADRVRMVAHSTGTFYGQTMSAGNIYTIAGTGTGGFSGDGGPATSAELNQPGSVAVDAAGNVIIADSGNNRVRVVAARTATFYGQAMTAGDIYTIAGTGTAGFSGDGGPATSAQLNSPNGAGLDAAGNLLIADWGNNRVRVAAASTGTFYGQTMTAGNIYTIAGTGTAGFSGDGGPATSAQLNNPNGVAVDAAGNLLIADGHNFRIRVVAARTATFYGQTMTAGNIYTIVRIGGAPATSVAVDPAGNVLIVQPDFGLVLALAARTGTFYGLPMTAGNIYTVAGTGGLGFAGDGGPATRAELSYPEGVAVDHAGNLLIADLGNGRVRMVTR